MCGVWGGFQVSAPHIALLVKLHVGLSFFLCYFLSRWLCSKRIVPLYLICFWNFFSGGEKIFLLISSGNWWSTHELLALEWLWQKNHKAYPRLQVQSQFSIYVGTLSQQRFYVWIPSQYKRHLTELGGGWLIWQSTCHTSMRTWVRYPMPLWK